MTPPTSDVVRLRAALRDWYARERRLLPWRESLDPYHVFVSELMLQQTRMDVVLPYFARWTERWPTIAHLAAAGEDEVIAMWTGLGYYRRARNLHAAAREIVARHGGVVPGEVSALRALPGVGPYTAAAVASIAHGVAVAVVDGNVERVLCRIAADDREPGVVRRRAVADLADTLLDPATPGEHNQALMELGALVCTPRSPRCAMCPWQDDCRGRTEGQAEDLPRRAEKAPPREVALRMAVVWRRDRVLLVRRPEGALLSGMWELPTTAEGGSVADLRRVVVAATGVACRLSASPVRVFRHAITNRRITVFVHETTARVGRVAEERDGLAWVAPKDMSDYGVSSMTVKALWTRKAH